MNTSHERLLELGFTPDQASFIISYNLLVPPLYQASSTYHTCGQVFQDYSDTQVAATAARAFDNAGIRVNASARNDCFYLTSEGYSPPNQRNYHEQFNHIPTPLVNPDYNGTWAHYQVLRIDGSTKAFMANKRT